MAAVEPLAAAPSGSWQLSSVQLWGYPWLDTRTSAAAGSRQAWALGRQTAATGVLYAVGASVPFVVAGLVLVAGSMLAVSGGDSP